MRSAARFSSVFDPEPTQWGLRGDPYLWRDMKRAASEIPMPAATAELHVVIGELFERFTGSNLIGRSAVFVEAYDAGGMSSGQVSREFWLERAIPLLASRIDACSLPDLADLQEAWLSYRSARLDLLQLLEMPQSCRDPLSEFSEVLVAALTDGSLAVNRVQKAWDVSSPLGLIQVKYLANPSEGPWVNWHTIEPGAGMDWYALVVYLDLMPAAVYMVPNDDLTDICRALGKRHGNQDSTLQFTKTNHAAIKSEPDRFRALGMKVYPLDWKRSGSAET